MTRTLLLTLLLTGCATTATVPVVKPVITGCPELPTLQAGDGKTLLPWILNVKALYEECRAKVESAIN